MKKVVVERDNGTIDVRHIFEGSSKTKQHCRDDVDINKIVSRYGFVELSRDYFNLLRSGSLKFSDVSDLPSYQESLNFVLEAKTSFDMLPALVRKRFDNDPAKLLLFMSDSANVDEAIELGLIDKVDRDRFVVEDKVLEKQLDLDIDSSESDEEDDK